MIKILFLTNQLLKVCGVSKHLYELLSELKKNKNINIVIVTGGGNAISKFVELGYEVIVNENFNHDNRSIFGFIKAVYWVVKFSSEKNISIIHSHHHYAANIAQTSKLFRNSTTILTNHGILPEIGLLSHFPSDHIIVVNQHIVEYIKKNYKLKDKTIHLIYQGMRNRFVEPKKKNEILRFISASRIVKEKRLDDFIIAISLLTESERNKAEFFIAGEGDYLESLILLESNVKSGVKFIGVVEDVQEYMNQTDVFVMSSAAIEGFPTTLIEAGYARNLIISSNFKGLKEIFEDNKDGLIYEVGNTKGLSKKLSWAIQNFEICKNLRENFYKKSIDLFDINICAKRTYDLYKSIER